jgi:hypothetical protein
MARKKSTPAAAAAVVPEATDVATQESVVKPQDATPTPAETPPTAVSAGSEDASSANTQAVPPVVVIAGDDFIHGGETDHPDKYEHAAAFCSPGHGFRALSRMAGANGWRLVSAIHERIVNPNPNGEGWVDGYRCFFVRKAV